MSSTTLLLIASIFGCYGAPPVFRGLFFDKPADVRPPNITSNHVPDLDLPYGQGKKIFYLDTIEFPMDGDLMRNDSSQMDQDKKIVHLNTIEFPMDGDLIRKDSSPIDQDKKIIHLDTIEFPMDGDLMMDDRYEDWLQEPWNGVELDNHVRVYRNPAEPTSV